MRKNHPDLERAFVLLLAAQSAIDRLAEGLHDHECEETSATRLCTLCLVEDDAAHFGYLLCWPTDMLGGNLFDFSTISRETVDALEALGFTLGEHEMQRLQTYLTCNRQERARHTAAEADTPVCVQQ